MENKPIYELTFPEWQQTEYQNIKIKYPNADHEAITDTVSLKKRYWINAVIERAKDNILTDAVIDSYVDQFGKSDLLRTFRGNYATGISQWEPKEVRLYDKSYAWMLKHRNELLIQKGTVKQFYDRIMQRAREQGKLV